MTDLQIVTEYRYIVSKLSFIRQQIDWNNCHRLPVSSLIRRADQLTKDLIRFDVILDVIPDIRIRDVLGCRYALGMTVAETAAVMDLSKMSVIRLQKRGLAMIEQHDGVQPDQGVQPDRQQQRSDAVSQAPAAGNRPS